MELAIICFGWPATGRMSAPRRLTRRSNMCGPVTGKREDKMDGQIPELSRLEEYERDPIDNTPDLAQSLAVRLLYERTLSACSRLLLLDETGEALAKTLNELRLATDASRVAIFRNRAEASAGLGVVQVHEALAPDVQPEAATCLYDQAGFEPWRAVLAQGEPIAGVVGSLPANRRHLLESQGILSVLILPLWVRQAWYGCLVFEDKRQPREWAEADIQLLQTAADLIGAYLQRQKIEQTLRESEEKAHQYATELIARIKEERRQREIAAILAQVGASISLTLSPNELLAHILLKLQQLVAYDSASVFLVEGNSLVRSAAGGFEQDVVDQRYPISDDLLFQAMSDSKSYLLIEDVRADSRYRPRPGLEKVRCWVGAPLLVAQKIVGYLAVNHYRPGRFRPAEAELVQAFAHQVAQTIYNARLFNDLKQTQAQLIQRERLAALGQMAGMLAHELRNPLMTIRTGVEYILSDIPDTDPRRQSAYRLQGNMDRIDRIIEDILTVTSTPKAVLSPGFLPDLIKTEVDRWQPHLAEKNIHVVIHPAPSLPPVLLDREQVRRVFSNLIANSSDALPGGGAILISLEQDGPYQVVRFADNGAGISPENLLHLFEPFFTTEKSRGTGLGLYIVQQVIESHQGAVTVESEVGQGTCFTIRLPAAED